MAAATPSALPQLPPSRQPSRYRSQRKATHASGDDVTAAFAQLQQQQQQQHPTPTGSPSQQDAGGDLSRSKSRYRRQNPATPQGTPPPAPVGQTHVSREKSTRYQNRHASPSAGFSPARHGRDERTATASSEKDGGRQTNGDIDAAPTTSSTVHRQKQPSVTDLFPPPKPVLYDGPPVSDRIRATKSLTNLNQYAREEDEAGCFGLFKRKRGNPGTLGEKNLNARPVRNRTLGTATHTAGATGFGKDAPVSAINASGRNVMVECGRSRTSFPVTPETTPVDIIRSAATCMAERIDVKSAVLLECFGTVGVQRPLRRYERVRDVLNSWDSDTQNVLLLVDPGTGNSEAELGLSGVPAAKPGDLNWLLHISQRVGKWDKRLVTLKGDGQITIQKDPQKPHEQVNVCHLSDFDIYTPTPEKLRKKVKPPKKICYAIKSQQKTSLFESTYNFVHFFCTSDKQTADSFYAAVQGWRSWYLVNVMGEGRKPRATDKSLEKETTVAHTHKHGDSLTSQYHLGSFKPLMTDADSFEKRPSTATSPPVSVPPVSAGFTKSSSQFDTTMSPERRMSRRNKHPPNPPVSINNRTQLADDEPLANLARHNSTDHRRRPTSSSENRRSSLDDFAGAGLLARTSSQRRPNSRHGPNDPPVPSSRRSDRLDSGTPPHLDSTTAIPTRHPSTRTKPLIDLTPQYLPPPQHAKKGRAFQPPSNATALIDAATSPEDAIGAPPSAEWRHATNASPSQALQQMQVQDVAFTGRGYLAENGSGGGGGHIGAGKASRAGGPQGPMVDMTDTSEFTKGSLLRRAEQG